MMRMYDLVRITGGPEYLLRATSKEPLMATTATTRLYRTERSLTRTLRVAYPSGRGRMVLRTEKDWEKNIEPAAVSEDGNVSTFQLEADQPFLYFKPCLVESGATNWASAPTSSCS